MAHRQLIILAVALIVVAALSMLILPLEVTRKAEIDFGNELVDRIEQFRQRHNSLPETGDWKLLRALGFRMTDLGTDPSYDRISDNQYELIYLRGFDGPYLLYNSATRQWVVDFPTIPDSFRERTKNEHTSGK